MIAIALQPDASEDDYADAISSQLEVRECVLDSGARRCEIREQQINVTGEDEHYSHLRGSVQTGLGRLSWKAMLVKVVFSVGVYHVEPVD
jgi:hypothetical protein